MASKIELTPTHTYATEANAIRAVEKKFPEANDDGLHYFIARTSDGRFFPVFLGVKSMDYGVHIHFNVVG